MFGKIEYNPQMYVKVFGELRRALCKKFPYAIYFYETEDDVIVLAVLHQRRNPIVWQQRYSFF